MVEVDLDLVKLNLKQYIDSNQDVFDGNAACVIYSKVRDFRSLPSMPLNYGSNTISLIDNFQIIFPNLIKLSKRKGIVCCFTYHSN